jgi:hypothetical protein
MTRRFPALSAAATIIILCASCGAPAATPSTPNDTSAPSADASGSDGTAASGSAAPSAGTTEPIPSDALGAFTCDLPLVEDPTVAGRANITDVRVGAHDGFDRVVFEFAQGTPELTLTRATPPFFQDPTGFDLEVDGDSFLALTLRGGTKQTESNESSYDGPTEFHAGLPALVDLVEGGDFEAQSTWYFGLSEEGCVRLILLEDPARIAIDIEH